MHAINIWLLGQAKKNFKKSGGGRGLISFFPVLNTLPFLVSLKYKTAYNNDLNKILNKGIH